MRTYQGMIFWRAGALAVVMLAGLGVHPMRAQALEKEYFDAYGLQGSVGYRGAWPVDSAFPEKGAYTLKWRHLQADTLRTYLAKGSLRGHLPHGKWSWQQADWNFSIEPGSGIEPRFATEGEEQFWEGQFVDGAASGAWVYRFSMLNPALSARTQGQATGRRGYHIEVKSTLKEGQMRGAWSVHDRNPENEVRIDGRCNDQGEADGKWTYTYHRYGEACREERIYERGVLLEVRRINAKDTVVVSLSNRHAILKANQSEDTLSHSLFTVVGDSAFAEEEVNCKATRLLKHYLDDHLLKGWNLDIFPHSFDREGPIFRRLKYLMSPEELAMRDSLQAISGRMTQAIEATFEGRNPDIARARSQQLDLAVGALQATQERLALLDSLLEASHRDEFLYAERNRAGLEREFRAINAAASYAGQAYTEVAGELPAIDLRSDSLPYFGELLDVMRRTESYMGAHRRTANEIFARMQRQGELNELEAKMLDKIERLDSLYTGQGRIAGLVATRWIDGHLQERIKAYAQNDDYRTGLSLAADILAEMDSLMQWSADWRRLDELDKELEAAYTYSAYNPYTGENDIPLSVKNRFRRQVIQVLLPYQRAQLEAAEDWEAFTAEYQQFAALRRELIRFAFMDERSDRRVERRVRQENRPERMLQIFMQHMEGH